MPTSLGDTVTDHGYAIFVDLKTGALYQANEGLTPADRPKDRFRVAHFNDASDVELAVNIWGDLLPQGRAWCEKHDLPAAPETLEANTPGFYRPRTRGRQP
jgi:hypothetical protein